MDLASSFKAHIVGTLLVLLLACSSVVAQSWTLANKIGTGGYSNSADTQKSVTDADGNTYIVGNYDNNITLGGTTYTGPNYQYGNFYVAKFDSLGNIIWSNRFYGTSNSDELSVSAIQLDNAGRLYVSGSFAVRVTFGNGVKLTIPPTYDPYNVPMHSFVCAYGSDGVASWAKFSSYGITVSNGTLYSFGELINGFSTNTAWDAYENIDQSDSIKLYDANAQLIRKIPNTLIGYNDRRLMASDDGTIRVGAYNAVQQSFLVSKYDPALNEFDSPLILPGLLSSAKCKFYKGAMYFLNCYDDYGNGHVQLGNLQLVSSDAAKSYHTEGYLAKYDIASEQFVWGKNIRTMDCGFNHFFTISSKDVLYVSTERAGIGSGNYIRAYSINGDSLWTQTSTAYIIDHTGIGSDRYGNVYVSGAVYNGSSSKVYFGKVPGFTYDYNVGFVAKISMKSSPGPMLVDKTPAPNEINISVNRSYQLTFSKNVILGTGNIKIFNAMTNASIRSLPLTSSNTTIVGNQATIKLPSSLPLGITVYVHLDNTTFEDLSGNFFSGISDKSWSYSTAGGTDKQPPTVISTTPASGVKNVDGAAPLYLNFSENILPGTGSLYFYDTNDVLVMTTPISWSNTTVSGSQAKITLATALPQGTILYIKTDSNVFKDEGGNPFAGISDKSWSFTTIAASDTQPPTLVTKSPAAGALNVDVNVPIVMTFSENIALSTGAITIYDASTDMLVSSIPVSSSNTAVSGAKATITLPTSLPKGRAIYLRVASGTFKDLAGNSYAGISDKSWSFTTIAAQPPTATGLSPANGASNVSLITSLQITFSQNIVLGSGGVRIYNASTNTLISTVTLTTANTKLSGQNVTIVLGSSLPANTNVYANIDAGTFLNTTGDAFVGINDTSWSFKTVTTDKTPPAITRTFPANHATGIAVGDSLVIHFNEPVTLVGGVMQLMYFENGFIALENIYLTSTTVKVNGNIVTITPSLPLPSLQTVGVLIGPGSFKDLSNNGFAGISAMGQWNFTTVAAPDITAPILSSTVPMTGTILTDSVVSLKLIFNEYVALSGGQLTVFESGSNAIVAQIDLQAFNTLVDKATVTVSLAKELPSGKHVYVRVTTGAINDLAGNKFAGVADKSWSFFTANVVTGLESNVEGDIQVTKQGNLVKIISSNSQIVVQSLSDLLGRQIEFERIGNAITFENPSSLFIVIGKKGEHKATWKFIVYE